ncbi:MULTISPECIES: hypothetical protein [Flavobacteriaceae]|uniref:ORC-CDC6 family AAA ATPase n=1 Tax=Flavobacteriaceae TaxID=49546 RepID=UPI00234A46E0|nr:hypothetical protein [Muricauda sp. SP22]MDC6362557.1 hypothetical protein [Muricauda sp. SP22]
MKTDNFHVVYNAKNLKAKEVAETFLIDPKFEELIKNSHSVLLGARGCGKTTMMKMLTLPALYNWENPKAKNIRKNLPFVAIYIPTDIYWNTNKEAYYGQLEKKFPNYAKVVSKTAVTLRVLDSTTQTIESLLEYEIKNVGDEKLAEFCKFLIKEWGLPPTVPTLGKIRLALSSSANNLAQHMSETTLNCKTEDEVKYNRSYFNLDFENASEVAIKAFEQIMGYKITNWAFCFDELELAPKWLQDRLFESLRSRGNQQLLYKLSSSPITKIPKDLLASTLNDVTLIKMWPTEIGTKYEVFSKKIVSNILQRRYGKKIDVKLIFGTNPIYSSTKGEYEKGGEIWSEIIKLAEVDTSFRNHLISANINPIDPSVDELNKNKKDTVLRKIKPSVYFRNYYNNYKETRQPKKKRMRKAHSLFFGEEVLYKICDGNPRWLKGIMDMMLAGTDKNRPKKISNKQQGIVYSKIAERFLESLSAIPKSTIRRHNGQEFTLTQMLDMIGSHLSDLQLLGEFSRDPKGSFYVDENLDDAITSVLEQAVYQGAIILLNPSKDGFDVNIKGKRLRLSYLFHPKFKLPLRTYTRVSLSSCIKPILNKKNMVNKPSNQAKLDL